MNGEYYAAGLQHHPAGYWQMRIECGGGDYIAARIYGSTSKQTLERTAIAVAALNAPTPSDKEGGEHD